MSRSKWKPIYINNDILNTDKKVVIIHKRSDTITKEYVGLITKIYNGIRFYDIIVNDKMIGHKWGEFSSTRRYPKHKKKNKWVIKHIQ